MVFTAQKDSDGYLLWSDASLKDGQGATTLNFLSMSTRGGDLGLEAAETAGMAIYNNWNTENGVPYLDIDGAKEYAAYQNGKFCYVSDPDESNVRLFKVGANSDTTIYNVSATVAAPVPGEKPAETANVIPGCTLESVQWDAESFDYETAYTVTLTLKAAEGCTVSDTLTARVNGAAADITADGGKLTVTYTFPETTSIPGSKIGLQAKAAEALKEGREYVISAGDLALSAASAQGIYLAAVSKEDGLTADMVFTAVGNDADGYALKTGDQYLAGRPVDDSPDKWGFMLTDDPTGAVTFMYQDGKMKVVSTGASAGPGGPPTTTDSYLYLNGDHFNFGTLQSTELTISELYFPFTDVAEDRWSYDEIYDMAATGIMVGMDHTTFAPESSMTRAMAITVLHRIVGEPNVSGTADYKDVSQNDYYTKALVWGTQCGVVEGYDDGTYRPDQPVTRQEFAKMVYLFANDLESEAELGEDMTFTDADSIAEYAKEAVDFCTKTGIVNGYPDGSFRPTSEISREEAAKMLARMIDLF